MSLRTGKGRSLLATKAPVNRALSGIIEITRAPSCSISLLIAASDRSSSLQYGHQWPRLMLITTEPVCSMDGSEIRCPFSSGRSNLGISSPSLGPTCPRSNTFSRSTSSSYALAKSGLRVPLFLRYADSLELSEVGGVQLESLPL